MNYIRHLNAFFFQHVKRDKRLNANHVSLYIALFQFWNYNRFQNPFSIIREEVMSITGIGSKNTYHKCMKEIHQFGYILYRPSINKFQKSKVHMIRLDTTEKEGPLKQLDLFENPDLISKGNVVNNRSKTSVPEMIPIQSQYCAPYSPSFNTGTVPYLGLLIKHKHINSKEFEYVNSLPGKIFSKNNFLEKCINHLGTSPKPVQVIPPSPLGTVLLSHELVEWSKGRPGMRPNIHEVISFFSKNKYPDTEAKKFYNHYQSNGWLVGGITPMNNWQSSAHKWMINAIHFNVKQLKPKVSSAKDQYNNDKNFSEPL